jgi:hypothetical protein
MPLPYDTDPILDSLQDELRMQMSALNELHHPVYPADPKRIGELERIVADIRDAILARRREMHGYSQARAVMDEAVVGSAPQAKGPDRVGQGP